MTIKAKPLVSIIVPVYNAERFIKDTIASVSRQTYKNWELILVDDASSDASVDIVRALQSKDRRIRLVLQTENKGAAAARNAGLDSARGDFLAFLDADDFWKKDKLSMQMKFMKESGAIFSFTSYEFTDAAGQTTGRIAHVPRNLSYEKALRRSSIFTSTVLIDLRAISKKHLVMPNYRIGEETITWWGLLKQYGDAHGLDEVLSYYRRGSSGTLSSNKLASARWRWRLYRKHEKLSFLAALYNFFHYVLYALERRV